MHLTSAYRIYVLERWWLLCGELGVVDSLLLQKCCKSGEVQSFALL